LIYSNGLKPGKDGLVDRIYPGQRLKLPNPEDANYTTIWNNAPSLPYQQAFHDHENEKVSVERLVNAIEHEQLLYHYRYGENVWLEFSGPTGYIHIYEISQFGYDPQHLHFIEVCGVELRHNLMIKNNERNNRLLEELTNNYHLGKPVPKQLIQELTKDYSLSPRIAG